MPADIKRYALIVAGGTGTRMGTDIPKQFLLLREKPVLQHTIEKFAPLVDAIVVVLPENQFAYWNQLCDQYQFGVQHMLVAGGNTRFDSVKNGLNALSGKGLVAVHDGVRPLIHTQTILSAFETAALSGNAVCAVKPKDSIRYIRSYSDSESVKREEYMLIQTPQIFDLDVLKNAYQNQPYQAAFTDDASVAEANGIRIQLCEGDYRNIKITTPEDLLLAEVLIHQFT